MSTSRSAWAMAIGGILLLLVAGSIFWISLQPRAPAWPQPPTPNAYLDLIRLSQELERSGWRSPPDAEDPPNPDAEPPPAEFIDRIGAALQLPGAVPTQPSINYLPAHMNELSGLRALARALTEAAESRFRAGHTNEAAGIGLDLIRFAAMVGRHGLMIDRLVGIAIENRGIEILRRSAGGMLESALRSTLDTLETLDTELSDWPGTLQLERDFFDQVTPLTARIALKIQAVLGRSPLRQAHAKFTAKVQTAVVSRRLAMVSLAAQLHHRELGRLPKDISELVPRFLDAVPIDPNTARPLALPESAATGL